MLNDSQYYPKLSGMFSRVSLVSDYRPSLPPPLQHSLYGALPRIRPFLDHLGEAFDCRLVRLM